MTPSHAVPMPARTTRRWRVPPPLTRGGELLEGADSITKASGRLGGGNTLYEIGSQCFILPVSHVLRRQKGLSQIHLAFTSTYKTSSTSSDLIWGKATISACA